MSELPDLYRTWERWFAEVAESHSNYPTLMYFRSPVADRSWLTGMCAILDASATHDTISPSQAPLQARLCLQSGVNCARALAASFRIAYNPQPPATHNIRLPFEEFAQGYRHLETAGFPIERTLEQAWQHFAGWRVNYEPIVDGLTQAIMPPPAPWFLHRPTLGTVPRTHLFDPGQTKQTTAQRPR